MNYYTVDIEDIISEGINVPLSKIQINGGTQMRVELDEETVSQYAEDMEAGAEFPPVVLFFDGVNYWLADGFHRYHAALRLHRSVIFAIVYEGDRKRAILFACEANNKGQKRPTRADKRRAVETIFGDADLLKRFDSDGGIARLCGVSAMFVGKVRHERPSATINVYSQHQRKGRDGRTINTANIGKKKPKSEATPAPVNPAAPLPTGPATSPAPTLSPACNVGPAATDPGPATGITVRLTFRSPQAEKVARMIEDRWETLSEISFAEMEMAMKW